MSRPKLTQPNPNRARWTPVMILGASVMPVVCILFLAYMHLHTSLADWRTTTGMQANGRLMIEASRLTHELQLERGMTAMFAHTTGTPQQQQRLADRRTATDHVLYDGFLSALDNSRIDLETKDATHRAIENIPRIREDAGQHNPDWDVVFNAYTDVITHVLDASAGCVRAKTDQGIGKVFGKITLFQSAREALGCIRGSVAASLASGQPFSHEQRDRLVNRYEHFIGFMDSPIRRLGDASDGQAFLESKQWAGLTGVIKDILQRESPFGPDVQKADGFFQKATDIIDQIYRGELSELDTLEQRLADLEHKNADSLNASVLWGVGGLAAGLIVLAMAWTLERSRRKLQHLQNVERKLVHDMALQKLALDAHAIVTTTDIRGIITYANDRFCELSGYTREELIGHTHRVVKSDEHDRAFFRNLWKTISKGNIWRGEIKNRTSDGGYYWVEATIFPHVDENGKITQYTAIRTDITELKRVQDDNRRQAMRLKSATMGALVGIWEYDPTTDSLVWDQTMYNLYGIHPGQSDDDADYKMWTNAVHPDDLERAEQLLRDAINNTGLFDTTFRIIRRDNGEVRHIKAHATIERDTQGRAVHMIGVNYDITDSIHAAHQIEQRDDEITAILDAIPAYVFYKDADNTILRLNRAASDSIGKPVEQIENHKTEEFFPSEDAKAYLRDDKHVIAARKPKLGIIERYETGGNPPRIISTDKIPLRNEQGEYDRLVAVVTDITEQLESQDRLRQSEERYALAVSGSRDGLWDWDLSNDKVYYAPRWKQMLGLESTDITDSPEEWISRIIPDDRNTFLRQFDDHLSGEEEVFEVELRMVHQLGHTVWILCRGAVVRDDQGRAVRVAGSLADITEIKRVQEEMRKLAEHDKLTGLPNRNLFHARLNQAIERTTHDSGYRFAILFFDFDRFKVINDSLGHDVGDALLSDIADRFKIILRSTDLAARFGGDEFVVLLNNLKSYEEAEHVGHRLLDAFAEPYHLMGHEVYSTASIGMVTNATRYDNAEDMLRDADAAMYQAKEAGKARLVVFDQAMHDKALKRLQIEAALRDALEQEQFHLVYQPIISLEAGELDGFEALIRWNHPEYGLIPPDQFIPIAEDTGLIVPIGEWALRQACKQLYQWNYVHRPELPININVNLSMRQVCHPDIVDTIRDVIFSSGIDPAYLKLEVTESTIIDDRLNMIPLLNEIKSLGIKLAMDDFGTGHSSLGNLHQLPVDILKIDQSFIKSMSVSRELAAVMHAIITLAHELGMQTVAEGIETADQLVMLQSLDCNFGQGYFFKKPLSCEQATRYLLGLDDQAMSA